MTEPIGSWCAAQWIRLNSRAMAPMNIRNAGYSPANARFVYLSWPNAAFVSVSDPKAMHAVLSCFGPWGHVWV